MFHEPSGDSCPAQQCMNDSPAASCSPAALSPAAQRPPPPSCHPAAAPHTGLSTQQRHGQARSTHATDSLPASAPTFTSVRSWLQSQLRSNTMLVKAVNHHRKNGSALRCIHLAPALTERSLAVPGEHTSSVKHSMGPYCHQSTPPFPGFHCFAALIGGRLLET